LPSQLGRRDLEEALEAIIAERQVIVDDAKSAVERATDAVAMASESLVRLDRWLTLVEPTRSRLGHALRKLQTPRESSASEELEASALSRELEISRPAGFAGCRDFPTFAATARRERSEIVAAAAVELDDAVQHLEEVTDGTSSWVHARQQLIYEDLLQRGLAHIDHDNQDGQDDRNHHNDPPEAEDVRAATQAIETLLELRDDDFPIASDDALHQATTWLGKIEGDSLRDELERQAIIHTDPVAVLGTIPLILDRPGEGMTADAIWHALSVLDRYVGRFQIIVLDPAIEAQRWAASLGFDPSGAAASSKSDNT